MTEEQTIWTPERKAVALSACGRWHGTPHRNRIAIPGVGVDCIQFVLEVLFTAGVIPRAKVGGYDLDSGMWGESTKLQEAMMRCLNCKWVTEDFEFGDIFILKTGSRSGHCGFYVGDYIWHALANRSVTKSDFVLWRHEISGMMRIVKDGYKTHPESVAFN